MKEKKYYLSKQDLEKIEDNKTVELTDEEGTIVILGLYKEEE